MTARNARRTQRDDRLTQRTATRVDRLTRPPEALREPLLTCYAPTPDGGICGERFAERESLTRRTGAHLGRRRAPHCSHDLTCCWYTDPASGRRLMPYDDGNPPA